MAITSPCSHSTECKQIFYMSPPLISLASLDSFPPGEAKALPSRRRVCGSKSAFDFRFTFVNREFIIVHIYQLVKSTYSTILNIRLLL